MQKWERKTLKPKNFPEALREIAEPPQVLRIEGELPSEDAIWLAVVGTRRFSTYGKEACEKIIGELAGYNFVIVSGLALGIDAIAHWAAIKNKLKTVAVPGSGVDRAVLHPRSNHPLAEKILENGGCLVSEMDWEEPAGTHTFLQRNRIIAGLSKATLVIEAPLRSGALNTAKFALEFNRDVFSVPGSIFTENAKGTNRLIKQGATPVCSGKDILEFYGLLDEKEQSNQQSLFAPDISDLSETEQKILKALTEPIPKDDLIRKLNLPARDINSAMAMMQIKGLIKEAGGEVFRK